ncbi:hypothetical protein EMWEY_00034650 [Eimeria maxima]|uniref:Uncharacterized protein n=1 Tax=Eimeria maxima TaxID=5804 RepID=U6ME83_EIMMA|nr:hypothetical protein EMWEY_00034650 [Eimeria maxima]CDJ60764.1 hypothetical protein EMWEY_00034650 [Eimeria maxima]
MQIVAAAGEGALPTQVHLLRFGDSALEVFPEDAVHPVTSKSLRHRWNGGVGGVGPRVAAIAAVVAVAAAYLVLHCVLYLANSNKSRGALRFLAGAEARGGIHTGESCNVLEEEPPPASATSVATKLAESEGLDEEELLRQARKYVIDLTQFVEESENVILQLDTPLRSRCIAAFLCVAVVELSALYSLLEEPKREDMLQQTVKIRSRIQDVRDTLNTSEISSSRQRHHACLDKLLSRLNEVPPPSADLTQSQQLVKMKHLLQLQKLELDQLCTGLAWLKESLESSKSATNVSKAAATGGKGAAPNAKGVEAVAAPRGVSTDYILDSIVTSIEVTVHRRRGHVFLDQLLGGWLRKTHETISHYGIMSPGAIDGILRRPHKSHCEHMRTMETTPLASGEKPWENDLVQRTIAARKTPDKPVSQTPSKVCKGLRSEGRRNASRAPRKLAPRHHKPKATAGAAMSAPTSSSSTTSATAAITTSTAAAAPQQPGSPREGSQAVADPCGSSPTLSSPTMPVPDDAVVAVTTAVSERKDQPLSVSNRLETESPSAVSNELSPGWPPTPASLPQHPAASLPSGTAVSFSASGREPAAASTSTTPAATDVGISSGSSLSPETSPRPLASSFGAPAPTAAFSSQDFTLPTQGPAAPALLSHSHPRPSWAAVAARGVSPASSAFHPLPAAPVLPEAGFDRAPGASRPRRSADKYVGPFGSPEPCATSSYAPLSASPTAAWQFQMKGLGGNTLQETDMPITGRTAAEAGLEALSQLFTGPPNRLPKWSNAP